MTARRALAPVLFVVFGAACGPKAANGAAPDAAATPRDGDTVFLVDEVAIHASEVEVLADAVRELYPEYARNHCRRIAIGGTLLPRAALAAHYADARRDARAACARALAALRDGRAPEGVTIRDERGTFGHLGLDLWVFARGVERNAWSGPFEHEGAFLLVRTLESEAGEDPPSTEVLTVQLIAFPYLPAAPIPACIEEAIDSVRLTIVDPAWEELVPERYKYRMGGGPR